MLINTATSSRYPFLVEFTYFVSLMTNSYQPHAVVYTRADDPEGYVYEEYLDSKHAAEVLQTALMNSGVANASDVQRLAPGLDY